MIVWETQGSAYAPNQDRLRGQLLSSTDYAKGDSCIAPVSSSVLNTEEEELLKYHIQAATAPSYQLLYKLRVCRYYVRGEESTLGFIHHALC